MKKLIICIFVAISMASCSTQKRVPNEPIPPGGPKPPTQADKPQGILTAPEKDK